ncbi:MAG: hypothetical protein NTX24_03540 [Candidatus Pacearchaeota archaeon]|nr:hypothetical protein [Candidatus Pacearchaeota archaeon]
MSNLCLRCKGRGMCGGPCKILIQLKQYQPKVEKEFSGSSPPEIFVGKFNYPYVYTGILSPNEFGDTEYMSLPESWHENGASIQDILGFRSRMIYSRFVSNIKLTESNAQRSRFIDVMQEIALAEKPVDASFELFKKPVVKMDLNASVAMIGNPAPLKNAKIESNPKIERKVDYLANDTDVKVTTAIQELYTSQIKVSHIIKVLSAGMLGQRTSRRLVPTRWAVTATDDTISKLLLEKIRYYQQISEVLLFSGNYLGNYYEVFLIPGCWSYEIIEISNQGYFGEGVNLEKDPATWQDYEFFQGRKTYADNVTGGYYAAKLPITEYLEKTKRQATVLVFREIRPEYFCPCGVGILRELMRGVFKETPKKFNTINEAFKDAQTRIKLPVSSFTEKSILLKHSKEQKKLSRWF